MFGTSYGETRVIEVKNAKQSIRGRHHQRKFIQMFTNLKSLLNTAVISVGVFCWRPFQIIFKIVIFNRKVALFNLQIKENKQHLITVKFEYFLRLALKKLGIFNLGMV